jgi:alpha-1,2-mannosyltransferase
MFPVAVCLSLWASPHALIYEWALLIAVGVVLWKRYSSHRDAWLCLFLLAWIGLTTSTPLALVQIRFLHWPSVVQISIPILGVVGWLGARELLAARSSEEQS